MILHDFYCAACDIRFEEIVSSNQAHHPCQKCGVDSERVISAPHVGVLNDPVRRAESLKKRSHDHSVKEARQNPDALAKRLGGSPKVQSKWNIRSSSKQKSS